MKTSGPFQFCSVCTKDTGHSWIKELTYSCNICNKETTVKMRPPLDEKQVQEIMEKNKHLPEEVRADIAKDLREYPLTPAEAIPAEEQMTKEQVEDAVIETQLPVQGMFVKATPLDSAIKMNMADQVLYNITSRKIEEELDKARHEAHKESDTSEKLKAILEDGRMKTTVDFGRIDDTPTYPQKQPMENYRMVFIDTEMEEKPVVKKGWADGL